MPVDPKRKRWASCGVCSGCHAVDCGECINCMDKSKFGGQGVRKQSCIKRRCARLNSSSGTGGLCSSSVRTSRGEGGESSSQGRKTDPERALFWAAVSGCMALHQQPGSDDDEATVLPGGDARGSDCDSCPRSPGGSVDSDFTFRREREPQDGSSASSSWGTGLFAPSSSSLSCPHTGPDSFCNKLASVLASDKRLASQPVGLRALRRAGVLEGASPKLTPAQTFALTSSLTDPSLANQLRSGLDETSLARGVDEKPPATEEVVALTPLGPAAEVA
uniref:CXXC-type domain-containing protein n=1 Tax=Haptolina brevifila TaxID=156173 RepID=A0A7S2GND0_9EUKA|mmetsp:Transcript_43354/g.86734  ORF Transcript_43354/g.86734 Transcript_43354/m.86734 type:complete len:276 (+) Transcript_43354:105-932(+)